MKKLLALFLFTILQLFVYAQPSIQWQKCLGGTNDDEAYSIQQTTDGGYILTGSVASNDGDVNGNHGIFDIWVVKLNNSGFIQWKKCLGGTASERSYSIQQTTDAGYVLTGFTYSNDGDVSGHHSGNPADIWVVKLDSLGNLQWQKCIGGTGPEEAYSIAQTIDGGYILIGYTESNDGDVSGIHSIYDDVWVVKLNNTGNIQWQKCFGGTGVETGRSIAQTIDGGYILTGYTGSNNGDVNGNHGQFDIWVVKLDVSGNIQWQKCLGGSLSEKAFSIQQTVDNGYILVGETFSNNGDVSGNHVNSFLNGSDIWAVKLDSLGNIQWQKCLGGAADEQAYYIKQTTDGGYILSGNSRSSGINGDVSGNHGSGNTFDAWIVKLDGFGNIQWQKCLGGTIEETAYSIVKTIDGGYVLIGYTDSNNGDVSGSYGSPWTQDIWVVKLSSTVGINDLSYIPSLNVFPNPTNDELNIQVETSVIGSTYQLTDITGRPIASGIITEEKSRISLQGLSSGTYQLSIGDQIRKTLKVVKE